ncbi:ABC transporter permease [Oscillatoria salina]|uniref:ABC transporter permease n=1 Tax=Oscillatoria salina TaxID=331517 RepID=UPI0013BD8823|nr:ABC transporter permease [Oscillatoria salina]MBZ8179299.1 FtsX-like permease family protein [Oscillatoria salina IIICB1]NET86733.1 FtsX-like permease family protein [Kamptonema sp. SIO1D9]
MSLVISDLLHLTYLSLRGNPLRSALTTLGVFMGVAAVTATMQVGNISKAVIAKQLAERDAPQVTLFSGRHPVTRDRVQLQSEDIELLQKRLPQVQAISSYRGIWNRSEILFLDRAATPYQAAVSQEFLLTSGRSLLSGRFFTEADFANFRPVVVIDTVLAEKLFSDEDPIGERIYRDRKPYVVVGVIESKLEEGEEEPPGLLLMPLATYNALTGRDNVGALSLRPERIEDLTNLQEQAKVILEQRYPGYEFWTWSNVEDVIEQQQTLRWVSLSLLAVGGIALLVGGVGIANITIASVMERTPEIGLRRALGATRQDIMLQFILEAVLLSLVGGVGAIATVHGITVVVADTFALPYEFNRQTTVLALGSALLVGVGASFFPALRASKLDPVKALRAS